MTGCRHVTSPVVVVMAIFEPNPDFLQAQLASIAAQTLQIASLVAVIADCRSGELVSDLCLALDLPLETVTPPEPTVSYASFELGVTHALKTAAVDAVFALSDQDDFWHPTKLEESIAALAAHNSGMAHCDARVTDAAGLVLHRSLYGMERRSGGSRPRDLLIRNSVTGMCAVMTRDVVRAALPFPAQSGLFFHHDLWLALVASCLGGVSRTSARLVDYRQHALNVVGVVTPSKNKPRIGTRKWIEKTAGDYAVAAYLATSLSIRMDEVVASETGDPDRQALATLTPFLSPWALGARFLVDALRLAISGRLNDASRALEFALVRVGRQIWSSRQALRSGRLSALADFDRKLFSRAPGAIPVAAVPPSTPKSSAVSFETLIDPRVRPRFLPIVVRGKRGRIVVLVPSLNPSEIFAGIATAIDLGLGLASRGHRVAFLATDLPVANSTRTFDFLSARVSGERRSTLDRVSIHCGVQSERLEFSRDDRFIATAWWSAHLVGAIQSAATFDTKKFFYLIQDFEPGFYPWGADYAQALASYKLDFTPIFNTVTLRDYFVENGIFNVPDQALAFRPAIDVERYARLERTSRIPRRLALYGRPEVPRNLFPLALDALGGFLASNDLAVGDVDLVSVGLVHDDVAFPGGHILRSLGKVPWDAYPKFLSGVDVGLSLMLSPHPSHPPIEMAASGARVVTNSFSTKNLGRLSPAILSVPAEAAVISDALARAWNAPPTTEAERRINLAGLGMSPMQMIDGVSAILTQSNARTDPIFAAE